MPHFACYVYSILWFFGRLKMSYSDSGSTIFIERNIFLIFCVFILIGRSTIFNLCVFTLIGRITVTIFSLLRFLVALSGLEEVNFFLLQSPLLSLAFLALPSCLLRSCSLGFSRASQLL